MMSTIATVPPTIVPASNWDWLVSIFSPLLLWVFVVGWAVVVKASDVIMSLVMLVVSWEGGIKYPGHSGSSSELSKTIQVLLFFSRAWCTGRVTTSDDVIHCSMCIMTSLAVAWALSWTLALKVTWLGDPGKHWNSPSVMLVCSSSQCGHCWLTPLAIPTMTSRTLSSGSLIYRVNINMT